MSTTFGIFSQVSVVLVVLDVIIKILGTIEELLREGISWKAENDRVRQ